MVKNYKREYLYTILNSYYTIIYIYDKSLKSNEGTFVKISKLPCNFSSDKLFCYFEKIFLLNLFLKHFYKLI